MAQTMLARRAQDSRAATGHHAAFQAELDALTLRNHRVDLAELVQGVLLTIQRLAEQKGVQIHYTRPTTAI